MKLEQYFITCLSGAQLEHVSVGCGWTNNRKIVGIKRDQFLKRSNICLKILIQARSQR